MLAQALEVERHSRRHRLGNGSLHDNATRGGQLFQALIPDSQLLVFEVKHGWGPLCEFLEVPAPDEPFPRTNDRLEFWDRVQVED